MSSVTGAAATLDDLYRIGGKAELINGRIVHFMPTGFWPGRVGAGSFEASTITPRGAVEASPSRTMWGLRFRSCLRGESPFPRMLPITSAHYHQIRCDSSKGRRLLPSRFAARTTTASQPRRRWRPSGPTTSRRVPQSSGTWTPSMSLSGNIERVPPTMPSSLSAAKRLMPNPPPPTGGWLWTTSSADHSEAAGICHLSLVICPWLFRISMSMRPRVHPYRP